jgi:hypothetical protein
MAKRYALIKNVCNESISINFPNTQVEDFVLTSGESISLELTPDIEYEIKYGEISYHVKRKRLYVKYEDSVSDFSLDDLTDCEGYGTGHLNVVRGDDPRLVAVSSVPVEETITLNTTHISNKYVTLSYTPVNVSEVVVVPVGGPMQIYGDDYTVTGNSLSWQARGMDGVLSVGDKLHISYRRSS